MYLKYSNDFVDRKHLIIAWTILYSNTIQKVKLFTILEQDGFQSDGYLASNGASEIVAALPILVHNRPDGCHSTMRG